MERQIRALNGPKGSSPLNGSSQSNRSNRLNERFLARFHGRMACIQKDGQFDCTPTGNKPVEKISRYGKRAEAWAPDSQRNVLHALSLTRLGLESSRNPVPSHRYTQSLVLSTSQSKPKPKDIHGQPGNSEVGPTVKLVRKDMRRKGDSSLGPQRMQSLPRSHRSSKEPNEGGEHVAIEGLARTNFQQLGYLSLSRGDTNRLCESLKPLQIKDAKAIPGDHLRFVKDEYVTRVLALGNQQLLLPTKQGRYTYVTDELPQRKKRGFDHHKVITTK